MRSAVLGAAVDDIEQLRRFVDASTVITHTDPKAFYGAMAVALAARSARNAESSGYVDLLRSTLLDTGAAQLVDLIADAERSVKSSENTAVFASRIGAGRGVSGYIYQTVPVAIHAWLRHPTDFAAAISAAVACGGDTDTVAAIVGGIAGASLGPAGIPVQWKNGLLEWPRSLAWIDRLARCVDDAMASQSPVRPPRVGLSVLPRNLLFIFGVGAHLIRRASPPY
jgi:ADP-ribosylglycohydrolase